MLDPFSKVLQEFISTIYCWRKDQRAHWAPSLISFSLGFSFYEKQTQFRLWGRSSSTEYRRYQLRFHCQVLWNSPALPTGFPTSSWRASSPCRSHYRSPLLALRGLGKYRKKKMRWFHCCSIWRCLKRQQQLLRLVAKRWPTWEQSCYSLQH